jgi:hypothetical protein
MSKRSNVKLDGIVIDRIKVEEPVLKILKERDGI